MLKFLAGAAMLSIVGVLSPVTAMDKPVLPTVAKQLDASAIAQLYDGAHVMFTNVTKPKSLTGEVWPDFKKKLLWGDYVYDGKDYGLFKGKLRVKGDLFCYKNGADKEACVSVYADGATIYETDAKKVVTSVNIVEPASAPSLPATAKKLTADEAMKATDGKKVIVTIYDLDQPVVADLKWDWSKKRVTGKFIYGGTREGMADSKLSIEGDMICATNQGEKKADCRTVYLDNDRFFEVTPKGKMHAMSVFHK